MYCNANNVYSVHYIITDNYLVDQCVGSCLYVQLINWETTEGERHCNKEREKSERAVPQMSTACQFGFGRQ